MKSCTRQRSMQARPSLRAALAVVAVALVSPDVSAWAADVQTTLPAKVTVNHPARENVKTALGEGVRLLEAKEYKLFVETFMTPKMLKETNEREGGMDQTLKRIEKVAPTAIKALKEAQSMEPEMDGEDQAEFQFAAPIASGSDGDGHSIPNLKMQKVDRYWYIAH